MHRLIFALAADAPQARFRDRFRNSFKKREVGRGAFRSAAIARARGLLTRRAVYALAETEPLFSARTVATRGQSLFLFGIGIAFAFAVWHFHLPVILHAFVYIAAAGFSIGAGTRFFLAAFGACGRGDSYRPKRIRDAELPVYSVLVPLFREADVLPKLADALRHLDYPKKKLDIKFVVEDDDRETRRMAERLSRSGPFETVVVPRSMPRTKPKACNYALPFARGKYLVIYDAEDRPDADQLRKSVAAFASSPENVACLQARLAIDNAQECFLSASFALDYDIWFTALLPGLNRLRVPMPLGGTSNHFRVDILRRVGAWDPFNVTEDADLGIRLSQYGYDVAMLDSDTYEEAPIYFSQWLRQRTRWLKGYMQTLLVHMRQPAGLVRRIGIRGVVALQLFIGGAVCSALLNPILWLLLASSLAVPAVAGRGDLSDTLAIVAGSGLFLANALLAGQILSSKRWRGHPRSILYGVGLVAFWMLVSVAAWRAVFQLVARPHLWEKTAHGQSLRRGSRI